jgi:hypothetical protein
LLNGFHTLARRRFRRFQLKIRPPSLTPFQPIRHAIDAATYATISVDAELLHALRFFAELMPCHFHYHLPLITL